MTSGPAHDVALRKPSMDIGAARLRVPPQDAPIAKTFNVSKAVDTNPDTTSLKTMLKTPLEPEKSLFQI